MSYRILLNNLNDFLRILYNHGVKSLKIDPNTLKAHGTVDEKGDDKTVYDHVIIAADIGPVQSIFKKTFENYKTEPKISNSLKICNQDYFDKMKMTPSYKSIHFSTNLHILNSIYNKFCFSISSLVR